MITIREATLDDVKGIRDVFQSEYDDRYPYPQYYDVEALHHLVYDSGTVLLVAIDEDTGRVAGTASVVFSIAAQNDLAGEFGRLVVHPDFRGRGIGKRLMQARIDHVQSRLHVGIVDNRTSHTFSQRISGRFGFVPVGFVPMKLLVTRRESTAQYVRYFGEALTLRRNNPRIIPEASRLAGFALENCGLQKDVIIDETSVAYSSEHDFELGELRTEGYAPLLRIERGRVRHRDVFGPVRLHYGMFQLESRQTDYLIAYRDGQVVGGIGFLVDEGEKTAKVIELISVGEEPIRFLLESLLQRCPTELGTEYIDIDVSAYSPRMQRTLLELGFLPVSYIPANVFHQVERLDVIKMARLLVPPDFSDVHVCDVVEPIANAVIEAFTSREVLPRIASASQSTPLFDGLNKEQRARLLSICTAHSFQPGEAIYSKGTSDGTMHLVLRGNVELLGNESRCIGVVGTGQCLSESSLLHSPPAIPPHTLDAVAREAVETAAFGNADFGELIRRRPDIGLVIYRNLAIDVSKKLQTAGDAEERIA